MAERLRIAIVGDFNPGYRNHLPTEAALGHAAESAGITAEPEWVPTSRLESNAAAILQGYDGLLIAPGSPYRSMAGAFEAIRFGRTRPWPLVGN